MVFNLTSISPSSSVSTLKVSLENSILLYSKSTGNFIAQAETMAQLADDLYKFNKARFAIVKHDEEEFVFIEGKIVPNLQVIE